RPVCPFFELHGKWDENEGPLTKKILGDCGLSLSDIVWTIHHANHKAYALTHSEGDRIEACRTVKGNDHRRRNLCGWSPPGPKPLVFKKKPIHMGQIQAVKPTDDHPKIRLRFHAPRGDAFGPKDLHDRLAAKGGWIGRLGALFGLNKNWEGFTL